MPSLTFRFRIASKALTQIGPRSLLLYARYQFGLRSGWYRLRSGTALARQIARTIHSHPDVDLRADLFPLPSPSDLSEVLGEGGRRALLAEADQIVQGQVHLFGSTLIPLQLTPDLPLHHWTIHARRLDALCAASGGRLRVLHREGTPPVVIALELQCRTAGSHEYPVWFFIA